ncbi:MULTISPECIES: hypothetical protein [Polymorphospora]|uniref:Uncharacterized protein n=1 Tax=Polymorphospora lycopeni TaxID=3140240 RepID=A0ABV5CTS9_9ACTN
MDFLMLLPSRIGIVIGCDGEQHYAHRDGTADPIRFAVMKAEGRHLRLRGYEDYRFGGIEPVDAIATQMLDGPLRLSPRQLEQQPVRLPMQAQQPALLAAEHED